MKADIERKVADYDAFMQAHPEEKEGFDRALREAGFSSYEDKYRWSINCVNGDELDFVNYLVKVDAPGAERGVMFVSHYDSTIGGPGAADDAVSVATMLEVLREMLSRNDLTNDLYFLFTDGEEIKMAGATAFVTHNPEMKEKIDLVINLEARGNAGTLIMFETSPHSKNIIKALDQNLDHITMFSVAAEIYKLMPNYTDLGEFLRAGYPGINFAIIDHPETYHQMTDNFANLSRDSAYMYLKTAVRLADYFGKANLDALKSNEDAVYFPFLKGNTIVIPNRVMVIISCFIAVVTLAWLLLRWVRKDFALKEMLFSFVTMMGALFITALTGYLGSLLYGRFYNNDLWVTQIDLLNKIFYGTCFLSMLAVVVWTWLAAKRFKNSKTLLYGCLLLFNLLNWVCTFALTGLSYIFTIPLALIFLYVVIETYLEKKSGIRLGRVFFILFLGIVIGLLYTPLVFVFYTALLLDSFLVDMVLIGIAVLPVSVICAHEAVE